MNWHHIYSIFCCIFISNFVNARLACALVRARFACANSKKVARSKVTAPSRASASSMSNAHDDNDDDHDRALSLAFGRHV
jgi:hypothetical protein